MRDPMTLDELLARLNSPASAETFSPLCGTPCVIVTFEGREPNGAAGHAPQCPVVGIGDIDQVPETVDVVAATRSQAEEVAQAIARHPIAAMTLTQLLRHNERAGVADRLFAESLAYSTLQHGAEFRAWLAGREPKARQEVDAAPAVLLEIGEGEATLTLNRPRKRNAYSAEMRDALCEALQCLADAPHLGRAVLRGAGRCFSAGGDLDEFGQATDAALAHASRTTRSAAVLMHLLRDRIEPHLHGACIGAGIELPAFATRIRARSDAFFVLPEVSMGLVPGAGGTASILPRIGRHRLAHMALTGTRIDARTALNWGLINALDDG